MQISSKIEYYLLLGDVMDDCVFIHFDLSKL